MSGCPSVARVPKTTRTTAKTDKVKDAEVTFESALEQLESLLEEMESNELPLEELLAHYEQGMKLSAVCQKMLAEAELKVQKLEKDAEGTYKLTPVAIEEEEDAPHETE